MSNEDFENNKQQTRNSISYMLEHSAVRLFHPFLQRYVLIHSPITPHPPSSFIPSCPSSFSSSRGQQIRHQRLLCPD